MREKEKDEQNGVENQTDRVIKDTSKSKDWAAADLEKVTDFNEDNDIGREVSNEKLDSLISGPSRLLMKTGEVVNVRKEDVLLIMDELELPRIQAEKKLIEHNGDIIAAAKDLLSF
ncbi:hypothetical protein ACH3XW_14430 [Acanthocheilonema viteae]|uniref:Nascent polypeptide-associated complex subunit alpha-like UBA domain-containing protein n=1 Tax=Acanthocheilonema viteae TaxID=6277 RepID=A0A498SNH0_ACAVI|nr:unnamed protein product [Acanthocheilonema viteae]